MVCNVYDIEVYDLRQYANDHRRNKDVRKILSVAADCLDKCNQELKRTKEHSQHVESLIRELFSVLSELKEVTDANPQS